MTTRQSIETLIDRLAAIPGTERLFNPSEGSDKRAQICRANLTRYLTQMQALKPRVLLLSEAFGYRGGRLTGIPLTSERVMLPGVDKFGLFGEGYVQTSDVANGVSENTASIVWAALVEHANEAPLLWSSLPLHPHPPGNPDKNRAPTVGERRLGLPLLEPLRELFGEIELILAVGRKAQASLEELGWESVPLRHPSRGGKPEFVAGLKEALGGL